MAEYDELVQTLVHLLTQRLEPKFQFTRGLLGDGNGNVDVEGREGFSFVRPDRGSNKILELFNKQAFAADGTPILIGEIPWQPGLQQVLGIDWDTYLTVGWENRFAGLAQHGETHTWRDGFIGEDPFTVYRRQIFDLRCEPLGSGSTSVLVTPYGINDGGIFKNWPGSPGIDLSAAIPAATGTVRNALVYWDFSGDTLYGTLGVATGTLSTVTETSIPPRPVEPAGAIPSAYVELQGGQAQIEEKHIKDARPIFSSTGGEDLARVSKVYESDFGNVALWANADGDIGINTETTPHGGIGWAKVAIDGVDFDEAGPHMQFTTDADDYPVIQIFPWGHDENGINFDSYYDGSWRSSTTDQNFQILATGGRLRFRYDSGVAAGAALSWNEGIALRTDGTVGIGTITPGAKLESVLSTGAQLRLSHTTASKFLDVTVDTNHDATFKPSSTGQIIFQPTTDSTDFLQVLDADGGLPIVNVDATNERVAIGTGTPLADAFGTHRLTVYTTSNTGLQFGRFSADVGGPIVSFVKSRNATIGQHTAVQAGDRLGTIAFSGSDGTDFATPLDMAQIYAEVDAVTGGTVYSGRLKFQTTNTSGTQTVAMTITDDQRVGIGTATPGTTGGGKMEIVGTASSVPAGPHLIFRTTADVYPLIQYLNFAHDNIQWMFDAYFDGAVTRSSDAGSNFRQAKVSDLLRFEYDSGVAQGSVVTWNTGIALDTSGHVGIGTTSPGFTLDGVMSGGNMRFTNRTDNNTAKSFHFLSYQYDSGTETEGWQAFQGFSPSGENQLLMGGGDNSRNASTLIAFYTAANTSTRQGTERMRIDSGGNIGIGTSAPQGILHTYDTIGGFLIWEYDGLDATVRTVVPNGAGDCLYRLQVTWVFRNSAGVVVSGSIGVSNGSSTSPTVGTDTVRIRVNADGSIDIARTAGTNTIKVLLHLLWL